MTWAKHALLLTLSGLVAAVVLSAPAAADDHAPCTLAVAIFCRLVPMAPDLDHDVDLTTQLPEGGDPGALPPQLRKPADACVAGCM